MSSKIVVQISGQQLVQYIVASVRRRRTILESLIDPPVFLVDRYGAPLRAIRQAVIAGNLQSVNTTLLAIGKKIPRNKHHETRLQNSADSLDSFAEIYACSDLSGLGALDVGKHNKSLLVDHTEVLINPSAALFETGPEGNIVGVGCIRPYMSKSKSLTNEMATYFTTLLNWFAEEKLRFMGPIERRLCRVVDVFDKKIHTAPKAQKKRRDDIADACREIADRWPAILSRAQSDEKQQEDGKSRRSGRR